MPAVGSSISSSFGAVGERDREFEPLEVAVGEFAAGPLRMAAHADQFQQRERLGPRETPASTPQIEQPPPCDDQRDLDVLAHRHRGEGRGDLEGAADTQPPDDARRLAGDVLAVQADAAGVRA